MAVVTEVISGGPPESPPASRASRLVVGALALAVLTFGGTWVALHRGTTAPASAGTPARPPTAETPPAPPPDASAGPLAPELAGVSTPGPPGLRLLAGGDALTVVDAASGVPSPVAGVAVPPGGAVTELLSLDGGALVVVQPDQSGTESGIGRVYLLRPGRAPAELPRADEVVAGARPGRIWAIVNSRQPGGKTTLVEVTTAGRPLSKRLVPESWQLVADTGGGLLVAVYRQERPGELMILDPVSLRVRRSMGLVREVVAAAPGLAAWTGPTCAERCALIVGNLRDDRRKTFRLDANFGVGRAVFSPDERQLAIAYYGRAGFDRPATAGFVEVLDLGTGRRTRVPGVATSEKQAADVCWSSDGRWLGIGVRWPEQGYQRLAVWPVSGGPVVELPGRLPVSYASALLAMTSGEVAP